MYIKNFMEIREGIAGTVRMGCVSMKDQPTLSCYNLSVPSGPVGIMAWWYMPTLTG